MKSNMNGKARAGNIRMAEAERDRRRIPTGDYLKLKKKSLLLYVYLQQISSWTKGESHRYIDISTLNKSEMAKKTGISRKSIYNHLAYLTEVGMIKHWTKKDDVLGETNYILLPEVGDYYVLVDLELKFMKALLELCDEVLLRVFLFHKSYSITKGKKYIVTLDYIAENIGYSKTHLDKVIKANEVLEGFEVIKQRKIWIKEGKNTKSCLEYTYLK